MPRPSLAAVLALATITQTAPAQSPDDSDLRAAAGLLQRGVPDQAAAEYRSFLTSHPDHPQAAAARYGLAVCLTQLNRWKDAAEELRRIPPNADFEFAPDAMLLAGQCALTAGDAEAALIPLRSLRERFPTYERADVACGMLGEAFYRLGRYDEAARTLDSIRVQWPRSASRPRAEFMLALTDAARGQDREAAARLEAMRDTWPSDPLTSHATLAEAQCRHRLALAAPLDSAQAKRALSLYEAASHAGPGADADQARLGRAQLLRATGHAGEAATLLESITSNGGSPVARATRIERCRCYLDQSKAEEALRSLASDDSESDAEALYWRAKCEMSLGKLDSAIKHLEQAAQLKPNKTLTGQIEYDAALAHGMAGHFDDSRRGFESIRQRFADLPLAEDALASEASVALAAKDHAAAIDLARQFLNRFPKSPRGAGVQLVMADAQLAAGQAEDAERTYADFLALHATDPSAPSVRLRRGLALAKLGRAQDADQTLSAGLEAPGSADPQLIHAAQLVLADAAMAKSDWRRALELLSSEGSADRATQLKIGLCLQRSGQPARALETFSRLADVEPSDDVRVQALFEKAQILSDMGQPDKAREGFERVIRLEDGAPSPRFTPHALRHLASLASKAGRSEEAADLLGRIAAVSGQDQATADALFDQATTLMAAGKLEDSDRTFERFLKEYPRHARAADAAAERAIIASRLGHFEDSLAASDHVEAMAGLSDEARASLHYERGWALKKLKRPTQAIEAFRLVLADKSAAALRASATLSLAELSLEQDDVSGALRWLSPLLTSAESDAVSSAHARYLQGVCELRLDHPQEAAKALEACLALHPAGDIASAASLLAGQAQLRCNQPEKAVIQLAALVDSKPPAQTLAPALLGLGQAYAAAQRWDESRAAFERHRREFSDSEVWFQAAFGIGWSLENQARYAEAMSVYRDIVSRHKGPTAARAQFQIGECLFGLKQHEEAVRELLKVDILYAYPEWSAAALYEAGRCLSLLGRIEDARKQFAQVVERFKDSEWARLSSRELSAAGTRPVPGASTGKAKE